MSGEVFGPADIEPLRTDLVEAVINAYMKDAIIDGTVSDGSVMYLLQADGGSCAEGRFDFNASSMVTGTNTKVYCDYPSGQWHENKSFWWDSDLDTGENVNGIELPDASTIFSDIEQRVHSWLNPWIQSCPNPADFDNQIISMTNIIEQLYVGDTPYNVPSNGVTDARTVSAVTYLRTALDRMADVGTQSGAAATALREGYTNDIGRVISGQYAMARTAGAAIAAESVAWNNTYKDLRDFIVNATADFNSLAQSEAPGTSGTTLSSVSAIATVGAGVIPPAALALTAVAGVAALGSIIFPNSPGREAVQIALKGSTYFEYWDSFTEGVTAIDDELRFAENAISAACSSQLTDFHGNGDNYSITLHKQESLDDLDPFYSGDIEIDPTTIKRVGGAIEVIGDQQNAVAKLLSGVDGSGHPSSVVASEWSRGSLPVGGVIGAGGQPLTNYNKLVNELSDLLFNDQRVSHRVAEHCIDIARDFTITDDENRRIMDAESSAIVDTSINDTEGHYDGNGEIVLPEVNTP